MLDREQRAFTLIEVERERAPHGFVAGLDVQSEGNVTVEVLNSSDGESIGRCPIAHARDIEKAAEAAGRAADTLSSLPPQTRAELLEALASLIEEQLEDLAVLECLQTGRSFREVLAHDLEGGLQVLRLAAGWARVPEGRVYDLGGGTTGWIEPHPHRVRAAVLPVVEPLGASLRRIAMSIASGTGLVLLAPSVAPLTVLRLAGLTREANLPPGAVNVLTSDGRDAPEKVAESPLIDAVAFAGPRDVARRMLVGAAKSNLKSVEFELDDKTPCVVLEDADIGPAVDTIWRSALGSACQLGRSVARAIVHRSLYHEVAGRLTSLAKATVVGHPLGEHTELGPLASESRMKRVLSYVELGRREGAKLVAGGERDVEGTRYTGNYVKPTVFLEPLPGSRLAREPIEGPVLTIEPFTDDDDAVTRAASGLGRAGAVIYGRDVDRARRLGRRLGVGQLWLNGPVRLYPALPHAAGAEGGAPLLGRAGLEVHSRGRSVIAYPRR